MNISSTSTPAPILIGASCCQVAIGADQACTSNVHAPSASGVTQTAYWSGVLGCLTIRTGRSAYAVGAGEDDVRPELVVALPEHRRRHGKGLAEGRLGRLSTEVDNGHDIHDGDASDHSPTLAERPESAQAGVASLSLVGRAA